MAQKVRKGRCKACGKPIFDDDSAVQVCHGHHHGVEDGEVNFERDVDKGSWGEMHETCFYYLMGDPAAMAPA